MKNHLLIPGVIIGIIIMIFIVVMAFAHVSGATVPAPGTPVPTPGTTVPVRLAPIQIFPRYAVGDLLRSEDTMYFVVVTGYNPDEEAYSYQPATVNFSTGKMSVKEGTGTMDRVEFEARYPYKVTL